MTRSQFIAMMNQQLKLIRSEYRLTQDQMADVLGLSKKTIVEIEKGRSSLGWTGSVALASLFSTSTVLTNTIGSDVEALILAIAFQETHGMYPKTLGGKVWWKPIKETQGLRIQQNLISHHYRVLDAENRRRFASFKLDEAESVMETLLSED